MSQEYTSSEMMTVTAARALENGMTCFVGIGLPSEAANLARLTHAPEVVLIYESGTLQTKPEILPLSIGDGELCESALTTVAVPEMFRYWLQGGKVSVGFLGTAQIDRFANLNTTLIGDYKAPKVRLPGGGGAPEIATNAGEVFITLKHSKRAFVKDVDFVTTLGFGRDGKGRDNVPNIGKGPTRVITDLCVMKPDPDTKELVVVSLHPGVTREQVTDATGWDIRFAEQLESTPEPNPNELKILRELKARTERAHAGE
ncbi:MAG: CoA-transferase subunit beta [Gammaproteobacteria bacterium]|uniref:3-oxoadipate--succinyl-CoA transferase subunit B n=1 Tax=Vreelandella venusta TaxID=44935 RepID=A0ABX2BA65_9GAMM|nr:CoA-transferase subunit beta [Halomonas venusta]MBR9926539.1 CoA-transferase subunit beta [Gammaproteobacteria bacterium]AZM97583.1 CoA-transferase subunit beta [Halomonas venusta]MDX1712183.1 CoA-transferase subunit beta [Halomonas venusta]NPT31015.1 3-oxoadipate--succinyl-CoA transferase subunit B [Halomonas venusta]WAM51867.1 CoA-transferase subunit beta [Halomonas venusta]